jgi:hypothetical protein
MTMAKNPKNMTDKEILVNWIKFEKQYQLLGPVQRMRLKRIENQGLRRDILVYEEGTITPDYSKVTE